MNVTFKIKPHAIRPGAEALEIWFGSKMVAALYQDSISEDVLRLFSNHVITVVNTPEGVRPAVYEFTFNTAKS
jgi:hypothetical protein